jgi:mannose-6-phosphate isomerase-like protein (cupin superfamily)
MESSTARPPAIVDPLKLGDAIEETYRNVSLGHVNDHEIRLSVMTAQFRWHRHPKSDETFLGVDGELVIEFPDRQIIVQPGQLVTVPAGLLHRTRPAGTRSVNLTFERIGAETVFED